MLKKQFVKYYKNSVWMFLLLLLNISCTKEKTQITEVRDWLTVDFTHSMDVDKNGNPKDSTISYIPESLFTDSIIYYILPSGRLFNSLYVSKEEIIRRNKINPEEVRDTFVIETDSSYFMSVSYLLHKMREPSLSNHYLGKEIYRVIALRSFNLPLVIRMEKEKNQITLTIKKLNQHITYPFIIVKQTIIFKSPYGEENILSHTEEEKEKDTINIPYYDTNYKLIINNNYSLPSTAWDSLTVLVDSANFWKTKPQLFLNYFTLDGSRWILEGHIESGYQIKRIPNPHFSSPQYPHRYDKNNYYASIFRYLIEFAKLYDEELY